MGLQDTNYETICHIISAAVHYPTNQAGGIGFIRFEVEVDEENNIIFINITAEEPYGCDYNAPYFLDSKLKAVETLLDCVVKFK